MTHLDDEERQLRSRLAALHREYLERAEPIVQRLAAIESRKPAPPIIVEAASLPQCVKDMLGVVEPPKPVPMPEARDEKLEREHARESRAKHGPCMNYPGCGCKVQHGWDCIPF
ncbi:hypothetical protein 8P_063 [Pseudomonas phage 8P]|nr:hypothetical protein 8P_063 [Pseudomonas phage 8P]